MRAFLLLLNVALTAKFLCPLGPLFLYLAIGYVFVLHASVMRERLLGRSRHAVPLLALLVWIGTWLAFKQGPIASESPLDRIPLLGLQGFHPSLVGASYIFLKVYDLIRRSQRGLEPPGIAAYLEQMVFFPSFLAGPIAGPEPFATSRGPSRATAGDGFNRLLVGVFKLYVLVPLLEPSNLLGATNARELANLMGPRDLWVAFYGSALWKFKVERFIYGIKDFIDFGLTVYFFK